MTSWFTKIESLPGFKATILFDRASARIKASSGTAENEKNLVPVYSQFVNAKERTAHEHDLNEPFKQMVVTLPDQYHVVQAVEGGMLLFLVLDKERTDMIKVRAVLEALFQK